MDANGTRFHLLLSSRDWSRRHPEAAGAASAWAWSESLQAVEEEPLPPLRRDEERDAFTLEPRRAVVPFAGTGPRLQPEQRRGAGGDRHGNWYWIDGDGRSVRARYADAGAASVFWPIAPPPPEPRAGGSFASAAPPATDAPLALAGLAVTHHHYLVAAALDPSRLLIFDLHGSGPPLVRPLPGGCTPFDIAAVPEPGRARAPHPADGGALILDRGRRRVWTLDRLLRLRDPAEPSAEPVREDFHTASRPLRAHEPPRTPRPVALDAAPETAALDPIAVEALEGPYFVVLDRARPRLLLFGPAEGERGPAGLLREFPLPFAPQDVAAVPDPERPDDVAWQGRVFVACADGGQAFSYVLRVRGVPSLDARIEEYLPMRSFGGKALSSGWSRRDPAKPRARLYEPAYDVAGAIVPLVDQPRRTYETAGALTTGVLVGDAPGCVWHRLFLDACVPPGCVLEVWSRAGDEEGKLPLLPFQREPAPRLRPGGPEVPWAAAFGGAGSGTWELLFQHARGRFLQLRIALRGPGNASPRLFAARAWYPRFSWLERYLPAVWRADADSAGLLERFLAIPEAMQTALEDRIAGAQILFDPAVAPAEALEWLGSWVALALDPGWEEPRRRLLLRHALDFYRWRGTARGLEMALRVALDERPDERIFRETDASRWPVRIVERFRTAYAPPVALGDPSGAAGGGTWSPASGTGRLVDGYRAALREAGVAADPASFPASAPRVDDVARVWRRYARAALGFVPSRGPASQRAWSRFLAVRYASLEALRAVHGGAAASFDEVELPEALADNGQALRDWWDFHATAEAARRRAHQFTIVLPVALGSKAEERRLRIDKARRLVELEKPAHTHFEIRLYWVAFRVGEARTGLDTVVGLGARSPELMRPMVIGDGHLAESYLAHGPPQGAADRGVLGSGRLRPSPPPAEGKE
jgi:phage tail-like protein